MGNPWDADPVASQAPAPWESDAVVAQQPDGPYPTDGPALAPPQNAAAWALFRTGLIKPGAKPGTINSPNFVQPGSPVSNGDFIVDPDGKLRIATAQDAAGGIPFAPPSPLPPAPEPHMSRGEDLARSFLPGVAKGFASAAGTPDKIFSAEQGAANWAAQKLTGHDIPSAPFDFARTAGALVGVPLGAPNESSFNDAIQGVTGPYHEPQGAAGRLSNTVGEFAPGLAMGGEGLISRLLNVGVPALASDAAGEGARKFMRGDANAEAIARGVGGLAGGLGLGIRDLAFPSQQRMLTNAAQGLTPEALARAQQIKAAGVEMGYIPTNAEAIQQATNGATGMGRLQRIIEGTKQGNRITAPFFADRPNQVNSVVRDFAGTLAPPTDFPSSIGINAQGIADRAVAGLRQARTGAVDPDYAAVSAKSVNPYDVNGVIDRIDQSIAADPAGVKAGRLADLRQRLIATPARAGSPGDPFTGVPATPATGEVPHTNVGTLNDIRIHYRDLNQLPDINPNASTATQKGFMDRHLGDLNSVLEGVPGFPQANAKYEGITNSLINPLAGGPTPLAKIAGTDEVVPGQSQQLFPNRPLEGAPNETAQTIRLMQAQQAKDYEAAVARGVADPNVPPPDIAGQIARQHFMGALDASLAPQGAAKQWAGNGFVRRVAGSPEQQATAMAGVGEINPYAPQHLSDVLDALGSSQWREAPGSLTAQTTSDLADLNMAGVRKAADKAGNPLEWAGGLADMLLSAQARRNTQGLASWMTDPSPTINFTPAAGTSPLRNLAVPLLAPRDQRQVR